MKDLFNKLLCGRDSKFSGLIALAIVMAVALGCTCGDLDLANVGKNDNSNSSQTSSNDSPFSDDNDSDKDVERNLIDATVKSTTATFANAISTEDFSKLYADTAQEFKKQYTEEELKDAFKDFIRQKRQLYPILAKAVSMEPEYSGEPTTRSEGQEEVLTASGKYSTSPLPVTFEYEYVKRGGSWKLLRMEIYVK